MKKKVIAAIIAAISTASWFQMPASAERFIEYTDWASVEDVVAIYRTMADPDYKYQWSDVIRLDVDLDGSVSAHDAELMKEYILMYDMFDSVIEGLDHDPEIAEVKDLFRMEMAEEFGIPYEKIMYFYGFKGNNVVPYYPDCLMIERITTIANGGVTGYAIQEDPYCGDIVYDFEYETGDIVWIFNIYTNGNPDNIVRQDEFLVGNVSDFGFDWSPNPEIVERALANIG